MKTSLAHLPPGVQAELATITKTIIERADIEMLILFGSYARGDFVDSDTYEKAGITLTYASDYDLLVVVRGSQQQNNSSLWHDLDRHFVETMARSVTLIADPIDEINRQLKEGSYFYGDIKKEGIVLYDSGRFSPSIDRGRTTLKN